MTWRACCSCRWKTPDSMPASPASILPPWALRTISSLRSSEEETSSNSALASTPSTRSMALDAVFNSQISGLKATRNQWSGARDTQRRGLRVHDRVDLRHLLAHA